MSILEQGSICSNERHLLFDSLRSVISQLSLSSPSSAFHTTCHHPSPLQTHSPPFTMTAPSSARRRLLKDFKRLQGDPPNGISGAPCNDNIYLWNAVIFGPSMEQIPLPPPSTFNTLVEHRCGCHPAWHPLSPCFWSLQGFVRVHGNAL